MAVASSFSITGFGAGGRGSTHPENPLQSQYPSSAFSVEFEHRHHLPTFPIRWSVNLQ
jgi:hypothetical protein